MSIGILILAGIALCLYAAYKHEKLLDRISYLEAQVQELELWKEGRGRAEDREIELQVAEDMESAKSLGALLDEGLQKLKE